jgi:hypothetical protein
VETTLPVLVVLVLHQLFQVHLFSMLAVAVALHTAAEQLALAEAAVVVMAL